MTVSMGRFAASNNPMARPKATHSNPPTTRTASERVNTPARAQNDSAASGAAAKKISASAAVVCPAVTIDTASQTSSHGAGGAGTPVPAPNTHRVVAESASWPRSAEVGSNWSEYSEPPENTAANTCR